MRLKTANDSRWVPWKCRLTGHATRYEPGSKEQTRASSNSWEKETRRRSLTSSTLPSSVCLPFVGPVTRRSQFLWSLLVAVCQIVLDDSPRPGIEEGHLFQASARAVITDAP